MFLHCPNANAESAPLGRALYEENECCINTVTFSGEKLLGIFPQHSVFSRDFPQQFNDQCYVICIGNIASKTETHDSWISTRHAHAPRPAQTETEQPGPEEAAARVAAARAERCLPCSAFGTAQGLCFGNLGAMPVTVIATTSGCYSISVCIVAPFKKKRYYLCG